MPWAAPSRWTAQNTPDDADVLLNPPPDDLTDGWTPTGHVVDMVDHISGPAEDAQTSPASYQPEFEDPDVEAERILAVEAIVRNTMGPPEPSAAEIRRMQDRANAWHECPYTPERLAHINELTTRFYEARLPDSWAQPYLTERLRQDITGHPDIRPGYAPDTWTSLVQHLHRQGVTDDEMLSAGVAKVASTGRLIDRFRDRVVFPIAHRGQVLGFVARRNPAHSDEDKRGPKYLNTPETPLFHKGDQLYVIPSARNSEPVLVEGPLDAIAVTLAAGPSHYGMASLGTSLTLTQVAQLGRLSTTVTVATDADAAGRKAAERDFWLLAAMGVDPRCAHLPENSDPADLVLHQGADRLAEALRSAGSLGVRIFDEYSGSCHDPAVILHCARLIAALPPEEWRDRISDLASRNQLPVGLVKVALASMVRAWNTDPVKAAEQSALGTRTQPKADALRIAAKERAPATTYLRSRGVNR